MFELCTISQIWRTMELLPDEQSIPRPRYTTALLGPFAVVCASIGLPVSVEKGALDLFCPLRVVT